MLRDLKDVKPTPESIIGCATCPFKTDKIGGRGPFDSPFVIVGESPGSAELARKTPFVGPSGRMLQDVLEEAGFNRLGVEPYFTNALSCYPMDKDIPKMQHATGCCQGRLHSELAAHPREVILCLGASAAWAVTGQYGIKITRDRGKILKSELASKGVVLAVHPAYLMRNGGGLPFWKLDLKSSIDLFCDELVSYWTEPTYSVIKNRQELRTIVDDYIRADRISGDYETDGLHALFGRVLSLGITKDAGNHVDIIPEDVYYDNLDLIKELVEHPHPKWTWHNGKFDIQWTWASDPKIERIRRKLGKEKTCGCCSWGKDKVHAQIGQFDWEPYANGRCDEDTMLASYTLNENAGFHDLDQVAQARIQAPAHKTGMDKYYKMAPHYSLRNAPLTELYKYQAFDIAKTHKMWVPLMEEISKDPRLVMLYYKTLIPATPFFARMERYGIELNKEEVKKNALIEDDLIEGLQTKLQAYAIEYLGREINFNSWIQVRELLYRAMKLGPPNCNWRTTPSDEDALVEVQRRTNHPIVHDLLEHREVVKRKGTYVINLINHWHINDKGKKKFIRGIVCADGRVHATWLIHGTTTGRPAGRKPNMLNQPRVERIRSQYKARKGKILIEIDLNQAELRSLAQLSGDVVLVEIYTENTISIHVVTTDEFFGSLQDMRDNPEVMHRAADLMQYFGERTPEKVYDEAKMAGKTVNFGIVYGREAPSIAQVFNVSHQTAQDWIDKWFGKYTGAADYITQCRKTVIRNQRMVTPWGRMKRVGVATPEKLKALENEASNFPHQSIAHDILLEAAMECEERLYKEWGARCWNEVYDAVYLEMDADNTKVTEAIDYVLDVITKVAPRKGLTRIPFIGEAKVGYAWGSMKKWKGSLQKTLEKVDFKEVV